MGFLKFISPIAALFGAISGKDKSSSAAPAPTVVQNKAEDINVKSAEDIKKDKQKKLVALNAGGGNTSFNPLSTEDADVTSKSLLGL